MNRTLAIGLLFIAAVLGAIFFISSPSMQQTAKDSVRVEEETDSKAHFAIFTNGTLRDFSAPRYHNQSQEVFISAENPMVVNVKESGVTWDAFFKTLPMKLTNDCLTTGTGQVFCTNENETLKFYLNGQENRDFLTTSIKNGDKALISYGSENEAEIQEQLSLLE